MPAYIRIKSILIFSLVTIVTASASIIVYSADISVELRCVLFGFLFICIAAAGYVTYLLVPQWDGWLNQLRRRYRDDRIAVLTFDDGPEEPWTGRILDILRDEAIEATFFVLGSKAKRHPGAIRRIDDEGHDVGSHGMTHRVLAHRSSSEIARDVEATGKIISSITGRRPTLFRAPHGFKAPWIKRTLGKVGNRLIPWTKGIWDTDGKDAKTLLKRFRRRFANLEIVLLHDGTDSSLTSMDRSATVEVLPEIIAEYRRRGYRFLSVGQMIEEMRNVKDGAGTASTQSF